MMMPTTRASIKANIENVLHRNKLFKFFRCVQVEVLYVFVGFLFVLQCKICTLHTKVNSSKVNRSI